MEVYIERCILKASSSDIAKYSPDGSFRVDFLSPIKDVIRRQRGLKRKPVVGLVAPTGTGKTSFLVATSLWMAVECGVKTTVLVGGKANRATVLLRYLEAIARAREAGLKTPRVLVFASKIDTCIYSKLEDIVNRYRSAENPDEAKKYATLFYIKERRVKNKCPFLADERYKHARRELEDYNIVVVGPIPPEIIERMKAEAPTAYKLYKSGVKFFADAVEVGRRHRICPYELGRRLLMDSDLIDIVVLDSIYLVYRTEPGFSSAFTRDKLIIIDEIHEVLFSNKVKITIDYTSGRRNILETVSPEAVKYIEKAIDEIFNMDSDNINKQVIRLEDREFVYAVPDRNLKAGDRAYEYIKTAVNLAKSKLRKKYSVRADAEVSVLESLLEFERLSYRVSLADREIKPGTVVAIKEYNNGKLVKSHLIPSLLSPRLKEGLDFGYAIVASGTLLPLHLTLVFKMWRADAEKLMAVVEWPVITRNRENYIIDYPAYYENRPEVAKAILSIKECIPVIVIASTTWAKHLPGFKMVTPPAQYGKTASFVEDVRRYLHEEKCPRLLISPHLGISKGEDLVYPDREFKAIVIAASESILPPEPDIITDMAMVARKYPLPENSRYYIAWMATNVTKSMLRVVQAVGRFQRSNKHRLQVVYIGRFFKQRLPRYYEKLYGPIYLVDESLQLEDALASIVARG